MSIKGNAEIIRDAVATDANTAARIGSNLVEVADDLIDKNALISANTLKVGYTDALVAAAPSVTTNGTNIASNATNVANNTANILSNATDIAANVANIAANTSGVAANLTSLGTKVNTASIVNDLTTGGTAVPLSAEQGVALKLLISSGGVAPVNNLTSTSTVLPLAANQGRVLKGLVDGNSANVSFNTSDISTNTSGIAANTSGVASNVSNIATNTSGVATNTSGVASNVSNITTNTSGVASNVSSIATNTSSIATNTSGIATNTSGVASNVSNIATNTSGVASNVSNIATNTSGIATNTSGVASNATNIATNTSSIATNTAAIAGMGGAFTGGIWNGLTYSLVTSPTTGKVWIDRNLGATRVANSQTDFYSFGWLFQYGRKIDDHQLRNSPTTTTQLTGIHNMNNAYVINGNWTAFLNTNCWKADWQGKFLNDVCPPGFRLPTVTEMNAEIAGFTGSNSAHAFSSFLKIPQSGYRTSNGSISYTNNYLAMDGDWTQGFTANSSSWLAGADYGWGINVRPIKI